MYSLQNSMSSAVGPVCHVDGALSTEAEPRAPRGVGRMGLKVVAVVAGLVAPGAAALALPGDPLEFFVDETVTYDSNVFRISRDRDPASFLGNSSRSDTRTTTTAGLTFDVPVSQQRLQGGVSLNRNRYSRFDDLDYSGHDARVTWLWQVGDPLTGQLGYADARRLASFTNFFGRTADLLTARRVFGSAAWMMTPNWRLQGGLAEQKFTHDVRRTDNVEVRSADAALLYVSRAENSIGIDWRQEHGTFPQVAGSNDFRHQSVGLRTDWAVSDKSHINARIGLAWRDYERAAQKDSDATVFSLDYTWRATDKFSLSAVALRDFSPVEDIDSSSVLVKSIGLRPRFELTEKILLSANADFSTRDYVAAVSNRTDHVRTLGASLSYRPIQSLLLALLVQHEKRSSNIVFGDYSAKVMGATARLSF